ncbi:MAG: tripartite tricarboxylate transporter substrate binding protein [Xanthobacteraceae bacterium]
MGVLNRRVFALATFGLACAALAAAGGAARADDDYPNHSVRWLVGYPPGGSTDICARLIGQYLSEHLHQQFAVENKPGAGNNLATEMAVNAPPDGYTLFLVNPANAINASLYKNLSFNFIADLAPVAGFIRVPNVMEVNPNVPAHTVKEFIDYAKANPGKVNMASSGIGTSVHLSGALFMMMTGIDMVHVPYRGAAPALTDMLANQVQVMFDNLPSSIGHIQAGQLRALAVTTGERSKALPDVPTVAETVPGYEASAWFGMAVPKGTPRRVIDKLNREVNAALADPTMQAKLAEIGGMLIPGTPEDFGKIIAAETEKWRKVVKATGATAE